MSVTILFFASMAALTFSARDVHNARLPQVTVRELTRERITTDRRVLAIPVDAYDQNGVFIITTLYKNGEVRDAAIRRHVQVGADNGEFYEVVDGLFGNELIIIESDTPLADGAEVFIVR